MGFKKSFDEFVLPRPPKIEKNGEMEPFEFFSNAIALSKNIKFKLGYFSTNALMTLSSGLALFIYNKGKMDIAINHFLSEGDFDLINQEGFEESVDFKLVESKVGDLDDLSQFLLASQKHFFNCLKYLMVHDQLTILPIVCKDGGMAHYKEALFEDHFGNQMYINGSCNFTAAGLLENGESFYVKRSWTNNQDDIDAIKKEGKQFELLFSKQLTNKYLYIPKSKIKKIIREKADPQDKDIQELLEDEEIIRARILKRKRLSEQQEKIEKRLLEEIERIKKEPRFPYDSPYPYQKKAYEAWRKNEYKGLFAMATGTGKTLTSIYCLIEEIKRGVKQKNIFVVPGEELVRQWTEELRNANFSQIIQWYSGNKRLNRDKQSAKILKNSDTLNIVITYDSFKGSRTRTEFLDSFKDVLGEFTVVFDEAHNMGAEGFLRSIEPLTFKRVIGLSATPLRLWDDRGANQSIESFFNTHHPDYTFSYTMEEAIGKFLVPYYYYPRFAYLNDDEWEQYLYWTSQIPLGEEGQINSHAAIKRQLVLDQASDKISVLYTIVNELKINNNQSHTLVYCPKGRDEDDARIILEVAEGISEQFGINAHEFIGETKDRESLLSDFESGMVEMLCAIKCLDEGVNVPRTENAIFVASGKNYREFVQRRGRVLRLYKTDSFEKEFANIYDIVVLPTINQFQQNPETAKKLIIAEFKRLFEFSKMAKPDNQTYFKIEDKLNEYNGYTQSYIEQQIKEEYE